MARPYRGPAGRVANCQIGVFLAYIGTPGHTWLDGALYLPRSWTADPARLPAVGLAPDTAFATQPALAQRQLARVLAAGVPATWVVGDTVYGHSGDLRIWREDQRRS